jgi:hypothetical protein
MGRGSLGRALALAAVGLCALATTASAGEKTRAYSGDNTAATKFADWMSWVRDDVRLHELSIPGTHDTVAIYGVPSTHTQSLCGNRKADPDYDAGCDVAAQLDAGIRFFDLRLGCQKNGKGERYLRAFHGTELQKIRGSEIFGDTQRWLDAHPGETVLIKVSHASASGSSSTKAPSNCDRSIGEFQTTMKEHFDAFRFWKAGSTPVRWPTLTEARGKMVLIAAYKNGPSETIRVNDEAERKDVWVTGNHYKTCFTAGCSTSKHPNTNYGNFLPIGEREKEIRAHLRQADDAAAAGKLRETTTSASDGTTPRLFANGDTVPGPGFNQFTMDLLFRDQDIDATGVVSMDFPGPGLIGTIVVKNLRHRKLPTPGGAFASFQGAMPYLAPQADREVEEASKKEKKRGFGKWDHRKGRFGMQNFLNDLGGTGPSAMVFDVMTFDEGSGDRDCPGLCGTTRGDKLGYQAFEVSIGRSVLPSDRVRELVSGFASGLTGTPAQRRASLLAALRRQFPGTHWAVVASKGDYRETFTSTGYPVTWGGRTSGMGYVVAAYSSRTAEPLLRVSDAFPVPGQQVRFDATLDRTSGDGAMRISDTSGAERCTAFWQPASSSYTCTITWPETGSTDPVSFLAQFTGGAGFFPGAASAAIPVAQEVVITKRPSDVTIPVGDPATFSLGYRVAAGRTASVTWLRELGSVIAPIGSAGDSLTLQYPASRDSAKITAVLRDQDGNEVRVGPAALTVTSNGPRFLRQPPAIYDGKCSQPAVISAQVAGARPLTVKWQYYPQAPPWTDMPGQTTIAEDGTTSITLPPNSTYEWKYRVVATEPNGTATSTESQYRCSFN